MNTVKLIAGLKLTIEQMRKQTIKYGVFLKKYMSDKSLEEPEPVTTDSVTFVDKEIKKLNASIFGNEEPSDYLYKSYDDFLREFENVRSKPKGGVFGPTLESLEWTYNALGVWLDKMYNYLTFIEGFAGTTESNSQPQKVSEESPERVKDYSKEKARNQVFISYSHKDARWLARLQVHLKPLERLGTITRWDDTVIKPGAKWREEIKQGLESAKAAILLISADFLASDFINNNELPPLLASAKSSGVIILPIIVSPCRFAETKSLSQFQAVNSPSQPLSTLTKARQEAIFVEVSKAIENAFES